MTKKSVVGIIFDESRSKILILKRRDIPSWVLPGGGVDPDESSEDAIIREVLEETGLNISIKRKTGEYFPVNQLTIPTTVFECTLIEGIPQKGPETKEICYCPIGSLPKSFFFLHRKWIEDAINSPQTVHRGITEINYLALLKNLLVHPIKVFRLLCSRAGFPLNW